VNLPVNKADWKVIGHTPLRIHFSCYAVSDYHVWAAVDSSLTSRSAIHHFFGQPNAPSALTSLSSPPRKAVASGRVLLQQIKRNITDTSSSSQPCLYRVPPTRFFVSFRCCKASELLAACIYLLPCMLSPPRHNRLIWRRTGMRYGLSASSPITHSPPSDLAAHTPSIPCPWC
jgi:hypothetical protein